MKKILAILLVIMILAVGLCACGGTEEPEQTEGTNQTEAIGNESENTETQSGEDTSENTTENTTDETEGQGGNETESIPADTDPNNTADSEYTKRY